MANGNAVRTTTGTPGLEVVIIYNDANLRIGNVSWIVPAGIEVTIIIWDTNVSPTVPVVERTEAQGSGSQAVPGNHQMVQFQDPDRGTLLRLPDNLLHTFKTRSVLA